jgi:signal transduction histidine kinase
VRKDGTRFWADVVVTALHDDAGELRGFAKVTRDMTERRNVDEQMRQTNMQLRRLSGHVQSAREEERTRVAREIHDELGQVLTAVKMDLTLIGKKLRDERQPMSRTQIADDLRSMSKLIDETIRAVREIITELRPEMLEDLGLKAAMEWQAQEYQSRTGIRCHLNADLEYLDLDIERATAVFRIFQEALTNVAKHANATEVHVDLHQEPERLVLEVQDNGRGITPDELRKVKSFGILGMRERAILFGGTVDVSSRTTQGTVVRVYVPLAASEDA